MARTDALEAFEAWWNKEDTKATVWNSLFRTQEKCQVAFEAGYKAAEDALKGPTMAEAWAAYRQWVKEERDGE